MSAHPLTSGNDRAFIPWFQDHAERLGLKHPGGKLKGSCSNCGGSDRFCVNDKGAFSCKGCDLPSILEGTQYERERQPARPRRKSTGEARWAIELYRYQSTVGEAVDVVRYEPKNFRNESLGVAAPFLPYGEQEAEGKHALLPVESEKCVRAFEGLSIRDHVATTWNGAGAWSQTNWEQYKSGHFIIWPDNDEHGLKSAKLLAEHLHGLGADVRKVDVSDLPEGGDLVALTESGEGRGDIYRDKNALEYDEKTGESSLGEQFENSDQRELMTNIETFIHVHPDYSKNAKRSGVIGWAKAIDEAIKVGVREGYWSMANAGRASSFVSVTVSPNTVGHGRKDNRQSMPKEVERWNPKSQENGIRSRTQ